MTRRPTPLPAALSATLAAVLLAAALPAAPARAGGLIDFPRLFAQHAGQVRQETAADGKPRAVLDLPGKITVTRSGTAAAPKFSGFDHSGHGAVGCLFGVQIVIAQALAQCPALVTPGQRTTLEGELEATGRFVAANLVPPRSWPKLKATYLGGIAPEKDQCPKAGKAPAGLQRMIDSFASPKGRKAIRQALSVPRLPVSSPCL